MSRRLVKQLKPVGVSKITYMDNAQVSSDDADERLDKVHDIQGCYEDQDPSETYEDIEHTRHKFSEEPWKRSKSKPSKERSEPIDAHRKTLQNFNNRSNKSLGYSPVTISLN
jgi:hypothetical protein